MALSSDPSQHSGQYSHLSLGPESYVHRAMKNVHCTKRKGMESYYLKMATTILHSDEVTLTLLHTSDKGMKPRRNQITISNASVDEVVIKQNNLEICLAEISSELWSKSLIKTQC